MCETLDRGIMWQQWHTLMFEEQVKVDMRVVCPQDVRMMLLKHARMAYWKKRAANHECEELQERSVDGQAPQCNEEAGRGRRLGAEKMFRHWLV